MTAFSGGEALEKKLKEMAEKLGDGKVLRVGFLEGAPYPNGGPPVAMVAAANEFGNPANNQPPRPFFRNMIAEKSPAWGNDLAKFADATQFDATATLNLMGLHIQDQLVMSINEFTEPALSPVTIAKKGFSKPLIDTAHMRNSTGFDVKDGNE